MGKREIIFLSKVEGELEQLVANIDDSELLTLLSNFNIPAFLQINAGKPNVTPARLAGAIVDTARAKCGTSSEVVFMSPGGQTAIAAYGLAKAVNELDPATQERLSSAKASFNQEPSTQSHTHKISKKGRFGLFGKSEETAHNNTRGGFSGSVEMTFKDDEPVG